MNFKVFKKPLLAAVILFIVVGFVLSGCQTQAATHEPVEEGHETDSEHESDAGNSDRLPNDGAAIHIISPAEGAIFSKGEDVVVEVEVENFDLTSEGNHWHLYVDGITWAQVMGGGTKEVLRGLEPGEHQLEAYLGLPTHEELEDGSSIMIMVIE